MLNIDRRAASVAFALLLLTAACDDAPPTVPIILAAGSLEVAAATSGLDPDRDGYVVTVDAGTPHPLGVDGSLTLADVPAGTHDVRLDGIAANCTADGGTTRRVRVTGGLPSNVTFVVGCAAMIEPPKVAFFCFAAL